MGEADRQKLVQQYALVAGRIDEHSRVFEAMGRQLTGQQTDINALKANLDTLKGLLEAVRRDLDSQWKYSQENDARHRLFTKMTFTERVKWLLRGHVPTLY